MATPDVSLEQLQRVHEALRIAVPLEQASPMILKTLTVIAHCWRGRVPTNLWSAAEVKHMPATPQPPVTKRRAPAASKAQVHPSTIDFKRRASGDND